MGIFKFSAVFTGTTIKVADFAGERIAVDAYHEYYRSSLGAKNISALTDKDGNRTLYLNVILSTCIEFQRNGIDHIWIFDNASHSRKSATLAHRKNKRQRATAAIAAIDEQIAAQTTTAPEIYEPGVPIVEIPIDMEQLITDDDKKEIATVKALMNERSRQEKRAFRVVPLEIERMKHMFDLLGVKWIDAPVDIEAEQLAAQLSAEDYVHAVYSGDTDPIAFGAKRHYRRCQDRLVRYTQSDIRRQISSATGLPLDRVTLPLIIKICVMLGCDFAPKTDGVGEKTVIAKSLTATLTAEQEEAVGIFQTTVNLEEIFIHNRDEQSFTAAKKQACSEWLCGLGFQAERVNKMLGKAPPGMQAE